MTPKDFPRLIGFCGLAQAGKTSAAITIVALYPDFTRISFADPIREMLLGLGLEGEDFSINKEKPHRLLCGQTPRFAMQTLGTQWGRQQIGTTIWTNAAMHMAEEALAGNARVVFDDVRFDNEASEIRRRGGVVIRIERDGHSGIPGAHESERGISGHLIDHTIHATCLADLRAQVISYFNAFAAY